jgi:hypothetical protein
VKQNTQGEGASFGLTRIADDPPHDGLLLDHLLSTPLIDWRVPTSAPPERAGIDPSEVPSLRVAPRSYMASSAAALFLLFTVGAAGGRVVFGPTESHETVLECSPGQPEPDRS